jgi:hypothetical protein
LQKSSAPSTAKGQCPRHNRHNLPVPNNITRVTAGLSFRHDSFSEELSVLYIRTSLLQRNFPTNILSTSSRFTTRFCFRTPADLWFLCNSLQTNVSQDYVYTICLQEPTSQSSTFTNLPKDRFAAFSFVAVSAATVIRIISLYGQHSLSNIFLAISSPFVPSERGPAQRSNNRPELLVRQRTNTSVSRDRLYSPN